MPTWRATLGASVRGRCLCDHIRYEYTGAVGAANYCHCEDCRRCTGSAFNVGVRFSLAEFRIVSGSPRGFTKRGDSGTELTRHFCPKCGSPIFTSSPKHSEYIFVKAGTLDDPAVVKPTHQSWVASAVPWSQIEPGIRSFTGVA
jgi:hypothetical protein